MIKQKIALLGAVTTLGVMGGALVSPAQAITYTINNGNFDAGGTLTGTFDYDASTNTYSNFNITSRSSVMTSLTGAFANPFTYNSSTIASVSNTSPTGFRLQTGASTPWRRIVFQFSPALTSVLGQTATILADPSDPIANSYEQYNASGDIRLASFGGGASVTAVPWETDALSVIGATTLFGFGVWTKRKRNSKLDLAKFSKVKN